MNFVLQLFSVKCFYEQIWLDNCPTEFKPLYYRRYVDDIFVLFSEPSYIDKFKDYMSLQHKNINFSKESENNNSLSFLDVKISRTDNKFVTNIYRKPTFSGVLTNFESYIPMHFKHGLIFTLLHRCYSICSDFSKFHHEVTNLKNTLSKSLKFCRFMCKNFSQQNLST